MPDLEAWGILPGYHDVTGAWRQPPPRTIDAITNSMSIESDKPMPGPPIWIAHQGEEIALGGRWELQSDDGGSEMVAGTLPSLEPGYYRAYSNDGRGLRLIVSPRTCHLPDDLHTWGWAVQLYAMRSHSSWGIGDLADLERFARFAGGQGASVVLLNPLHASAPTRQQQASPYYPSSRCFRNPIYLRVEDVPGAGDVAPDLEALAAAGRALLDNRRVDRDEVWRLKMDALNRIFAAVPPGEDFERFVYAGGDLLQRYATHCVLAEQYGGDWRSWPEEYRDPASFESRQVASEQRGRLRFHQWLQWLVERQLEAAGAHVGLMQDLAIGVDPGGADAWMWQDVLVPDMSVGAPPDEYNSAGQDWGLPPFDPWKLRDAEYEPFVQTVRAGLRHAGGLRVDHVMGLFRLFWIPSGASPRDGTYVRYPADDLLDVLALESHLAGAYVVGEDLGTVEDSVRAALAERHVLSYRLFWFEPGPPSSYPRDALAAVTTHDLPTVAGVCSGSDGTDDLRGKVADVAGDADMADVVVRVYESLASAPSRLVTATLDDALRVEERPNYPGTVEDSNWSVALPKPLEEIEADPVVARIAEVLRDRPARTEL